MPTLYPLKFKTIFKERIWGGDKIRTILGKDFSPMPICGETWEISAVEGDVSEVKGGSLEGRTLSSLIDEYKGQLVGNAVYKQFGSKFPLLIKFIDAREDLSIQLHPNDELAQKRHNSFGKTEMWYAFQADQGAKVRSGFNRVIDQDTYIKHLEDRKLDDILNVMDVAPDDVFFLPAGRVHSIGAGMLVAEIQQTSDVTYRIYDFDRKDAKGNTRELHTEQALEAIDYAHYNEYKSTYNKNKNEVASLVSSQYFTTNRLYFDQSVTRDYAQLDSFVIYVCVDGSLTLMVDGKSIEIKKGEAVLLPAAIKQVELKPSPEFKLMECYVPGK
ncbi:MAG: type I phosphomannose isomerase catalytic subunit [Bacteroidota bacterium]